MWSTRSTLLLFGSQLVSRRRPNSIILGRADRHVCRGYAVHAIRDLARHDEDPRGETSGRRTHRSTRESCGTGRFDESPATNQSSRQPPRIMCANLANARAPGRLAATSRTASCAPANFVTVFAPAALTGRHRRVRSDVASRHHKCALMLSRCELVAVATVADFGSRSHHQVSAVVQTVPTRTRSPVQAPDGSPALTCPAVHRDSTQPTR